jgi:hypothetical protein
MTEKARVDMTALDFDEIKQLNARYCHSLDFADVDGLVGCFASDAVMEVGGELLRGRRDLESFAREDARRTKGHYRRFTIAELIGGDGTSARAVSYGVVSRDFGQPFGKGQATHATVLTSGIYLDDLVRDQGRWVYAKRRLCRDGSSEAIDLIGKPLEVPHVQIDQDVARPRAGMTALDYEAIRQLQARYCYTLDLEDTDGFAGCFTRDGSFEALSEADDLAGVKRGTAALREFAETVGAILRGLRVSGRHSAISVLVEGDGKNARASSYGFILGAHHGEQMLAVQRGNSEVGNTGIYRDALVKRDGRWLFQRRTFRYDGWPDVIAMVDKPLVLQVFEQ